MSGNVFEWCSDRWGIYPSYDETNPTGPTTGSVRVQRGGSWFMSAFGCRVVYRNSYSTSGPAFGWYDYGFRLAFSSN